MSQPLWFQWSLWGLWKLGRGLAWAWRLVRKLCLSTLLRRLVSAAVLLALVGASLLLGPLAWRRAAFLHEASDLASRSEGMDLDAMREELRRRAFALGFRDIVLQPEAVRIHQEADDLGPLCVVQLDFRQRVSIGPLEATIPVQGVVRRRVLGPRPQRTSPGLERLVE